MPKTNKTKSIKNKCIKTIKIKTALFIIILFAGM